MTQDCTPSTVWSARADAAEARQDWDHAAEYWWRAATTLQGNPRGLRTYFHQREDAAKARALQVTA